MASQCAPVSKQTHIHHLTDECLVIILSRIGNPPLPIPRPNHRNVQISHPLQCALVCRRWRSSARASVHSLRLSTHALSLPLSLQAPYFTGLRHLSIHSRASRVPALPCLLRIAEATPALESFHFNGRQLPSPEDLFPALRSWTSLTELSLRASELGAQSSGRLQGMLFLALPGMPSVQRLSLALVSLDSVALWQSLGARPTHLALDLRLSEPPPRSLAKAPSLHLCLNSLPRPLLAFRNIVMLSLVQFNEAELPSELGSMGRLESLTIELSDSLTSVRGSLGKLVSLRVLEFKSCARLKTLPDSVWRLSALTALRLHSCERTMRLPYNITRLTSLEELSLKELPGLQALPGGLGLLRRLECLEISGKGGGKEESLGYLRSLPATLTELARLTRFSFLDWPFVWALPRHIGSLSVLRELHLAGLGRMQKLPESVGRLRALLFLNVERCGLTTLPQTVGQLSSLKRLRLTGCGRLRSLPDTMGDLKGLEELHVERCAVVECLPLGLSRLTDLRELVVRNNDGFYDKYGVIRELQGLRFLGLVGCKDLGRAVDGLTGLIALRAIICSAAMVKSVREVFHGTGGVVEIMVVDHDVQDVAGRGDTDRDLDWERFDSAQEEDYGGGDDDEGDDDDDDNEEDDDEDDGYDDEGDDDDDDEDDGDDDDEDDGDDDEGGDDDDDGNGVDDDRDDGDDDEGDDEEDDGDDDDVGNEEDDDDDGGEGDDDDGDSDADWGEDEDGV